jgi:hypothetical protein
MFVIPLSAFILPNPEIIQGERRKVAAFPDLPDRFTARAIKKYFKKINGYLADRLPFRSTMLLIAMKVFKNTNDNQYFCIRGSENWLFLGNGYVNAIDKLQGKLKLSGVTLVEAIKKYVRIRDIAIKRGAKFYLFIGPNKSSVYPEYLPALVIPAKQRFITPLLTSLKEKGVDVYDPTPALIKAKQAGSAPLYFKTDSHWNLLGGYEAFQGFLAFAGFANMPQPLSFVDGPPYSGDAFDAGGYDFFPLASDDNRRPIWAQPINISGNLDTIVKNYDPSERRDPQKIITNFNPVSEKIVWVFGDSFRTALKPYFAATFKESHFYRQIEFDQIISSQLPAPDLIIWINVERGLELNYFSGF